ncbi:hypothetical protein AVEN_231196-1 [Araneus ventricosus]|uniref:Uncharacterized protein n=1 Tax=Araneus ventricosus TaxID=182803 RepID=A0A4Y2GX83_ARAVE|nr:hypothetical protein AVEN_231196-1 [Araneus ventricosus]
MLVFWPNLGFETEELYLNPAWFKRPRIVVARKFEDGMPPEVSPSGPFFQIKRNSRRTTPKFGRSIGNKELFPHNIHSGARNRLSPAYVEWGVLRRDRAHRVKAFV